MAKKANEIKELLGLDGLSDWLHQHKNWKAELVRVDHTGAATVLHILFTDGSSLEMSR